MSLLSEVADGSISLFEFSDMYLENIFLNFVEVCFITARCKMQAGE